MLLVYDVTNEESFESLKTSIESFNYLNKNPQKLLIIVGNKADKGVPRAVVQSDAEEFAKEYGL